MAADIIKSIVDKGAS